MPSREDHGKRGNLFYIFVNRSYVNYPAVKKIQDFLDNRISHNLCLEVFFPHGFFLYRFNLKPDLVPKFFRKYLLYDSPSSSLSNPKRGNTRRARSAQACRQKL